MSQTDSPEGRANTWGEPLPRLLQLNEEIVVFEGLCYAAEIDHSQSGYHSRADWLLLPALGGLVLNVAWHNYQKKFYKGESVRDPFDLEINLDDSWRGNQIFSAVLDLAPDALDAAWRDEEGRFMLAPSAAERGETPQAEFTTLLVRKITSGVKLEILDTPTGSYIARPDSETDRPIIFRQFRPFGWEFFGDGSSDPKALHIPNPADLCTLRAKFTAEDPNFTGDGFRPLVGGRTA